MAWTELSLDTTGEAVDWVCTLLARNHFDGELRRVAYKEGAIATNWMFTLFFYLPADLSRAQCDEIEQVLAPLVRTELATPLRWAIITDKPTDTSLATPSDRLKHWVGGFVILTTPAGRSGDRPPVDLDWGDQIPLYIPPSLAFGSGLHPATVLSLQLLARHVTPAMSVLDLGSGSGILSVAMAKLGAQVLAIDNDAVAVQASQQAALSNGVEAQITVMQASLGQGSQLGHWLGDENQSGVSVNIAETESEVKFDLIAANIFARVHIALADDYRQALLPGGLLMTAGFTEEYTADVQAALMAVGFAPIDQARSQDWIAMVYRLNPPDRTD